MTGKAVLTLNKEYEITMSTSCILGSGRKINVEVLLKINESGFDNVISTEMIKVNLKEVSVATGQKQNPGEIKAVSKVDMSTSAVISASALESIIMSKLKSKDVAISSSTGSTEEDEVESSSMSVSATETVCQSSETVKEVKETKAAVKNVHSGIVAQKHDEKPHKPEASNKSYRVVEGDTLKSVAKMFYGDTSRWIEIYDANSDKIEKGSLRKDDVLIIP
jgi:nucleoid-associated protein YgaU